MEQINHYLDAFRKDAQFMREMGFNPYSEQLRIVIPDARDKLFAALQYYLGDRAQWLPAYDEIADWLTDNKGRGLLCVGGCGLGKTLICQYILPLLIYQHLNIISEAVTANEMNARIDALLHQRCVVVDDLGTEAAETQTYGNRRYPFSELCDSVERRGSLLIVTTNLYPNHFVDKSGQTVPSIEDRYGLRTYDRLRAITKVIVFKGKSMRG